MQMIVSDYNQVKKIVEKHNFEKDNNILFRGEPNALVPSIVNKCVLSTYADLVVKENLLLDEFNNYSHIKYKFTNGNEHDWETRIAAREYGLASSLMDWTNSLDIALEFAIHDFLKKNRSHTSLWILDKSKLEQVHISAACSINANEINKPTIIQYSQYSEETYYRRKSIQGGYFLKQPYQQVIMPLNLNPYYTESLTQIIIPSSAVSNIWKNLTAKYNLDLDLCANFNPSDKALSKICNGINLKYK